MGANGLRAGHRRDNDRCVEYASSSCHTFWARANTPAPKGLLRPAKKSHCLSKCKANDQASSSSSSVLLAGVTSAVSTATVGQRSAVASSVVSGTVGTISSHEGEKACEEREIRNQLSDCVTGTGQIVNIEWSVPGCLSSVWGHPQPSQGCSVLHCYQNCLISSKKYSKPISILGLILGINN